MKDGPLTHHATTVNGLDVVAVALVRDDRQRHAVYSAVWRRREHSTWVVLSGLVADVAVHLDEVGVLLAAADQTVVHELRALAQTEHAEALGLDLIHKEIIPRAPVVSAQGPTDDP